VPAIVAAMTRLRGFAHLQIGRPVIRRGKSGHFCDKALEGVSHHAIVPNVNVMDDLEARIARLSDDEKRLFALICRSYLAAVMPDFEYRQTVVTMNVPLPDQGSGAAEFRAVGRSPLVQGWKAAFGAADPEPGRGKEGEAEAEQALPRLANGETATLSDPRVEEKQTQRRPRAPRSSRASSARTCWPPTASWSCRRRQACSCLSCCAAPPLLWSIPRPQPSGRCGSTMSWWARRISAPSSTRSPARRIG
jgi:DNA topoisomerase-3